MSFALITTEPKNDSSPINHKILLILEYQDERVLIGLSYLGLFARFSGGGQYRPTYNLTSETINALAFFPKIFFYMQSRHDEFVSPKMTYENHVIQAAPDEVGTWPIHAEAISCLNQSSNPDILKNHQLPVIQTVYNLFSKHFAQKMEEGYSAFKNATKDFEKAVIHMPQSTHKEVGTFFQELISLLKNNVMESYSLSIEDKLLKGLLYYKENPNSLLCNKCGKIFKNAPHHNKLKDLFDAACREKTFQYCSEKCFVDHLTDESTYVPFIDVDQFVPEGTVDAFKETLAEFGVSQKYLERLSIYFEERFTALPF